MHAMLLERAGEALRWTDMPDREPAAGQLRVRILACGVCRTDLHLIDGELPQARYPVIPGHEIVGRIDAVGPGVDGLRVGERVGIPWLAHSCGSCAYCREGRENLCDHPLFTGCSVDGGYATAALADARYAFPLGDDADPVDQAPLLCAGLIGWRALVAAGSGRRIGLYGFGAAAHIVAQVAAWQGREVHAFTRPGDTAAQEFARRVGVNWAGGSDQAPPRQLDAAILFAPVGALVPEALSRLRKGGRVVCAGIHMSPIPSFAYDLLWHERQIVSVANLTRGDGEAFLRIAPRAGVRTHTRRYDLRDANVALDDLRAGRLEGAAVLVP